MSSRAALVLVVAWSVLTLAYLGYTSTRTPALVFARDASGLVTVARERWIGEATVEEVDTTRGAPDLRLEPTGRASCRLVLAPRPSPGASEDLRELASWARASGCAYAEHFVDSAARSLQGGTAFHTRVPVTGSEIWWPLPLLLLVLFLLVRRRATHEAAPQSP